MSNERKNPTISYLFQGESILITVDGRSYVVKKGVHLNYDEIVEALHNGDDGTVAKLVDVGASIAEFYASDTDNEPDIEIRNRGVYYKGKRIHNSLTRRLVEMYREKRPLGAMVEFLRNLMQNPSNRAVQELYTFLERNSLPLTTDGCFLAFKRVKVVKTTDEDGNEVENFVDVRTGQVDNNLGMEVSMDRNEVADDPRVSCSKGLHACSMEYLRDSGYGDWIDASAIVVVKIDPKDVVSVPYDYNHSKLRICKYWVMWVHETGEEDDKFDSSVQSIPAQDD